MAWYMVLHDIWYDMVYILWYFKNLLLLILMKKLDSEGPTQLIRDWSLFMAGVGPEEKKVG